MSFHVNREKRNWMIVDFFLFLRCVILGVCVSQWQLLSKWEKLMIQEKDGLSSGVVWSS